MMQMLGAVCLLGDEVQAPSHWGRYRVSWRDMLRIS